MSSQTGTSSASHRDAVKFRPSCIPMTAMRVGVNAWPYMPGKVGGGETYLLNLLKELQKVDVLDLIVFTTPFNDQVLRGMGLNCVMYPVPANRRGLRVALEQAFLPWLCRRHSIDVLHTPANISLLFPSCPMIVTIHDMHYTEYSTGIRGMYYRLLLPISARRSSRIITDSRLSANQILSRTGVSCDRVTVVHLAADDAFLSDHGTGVPNWSSIASYGLGKCYLLYVGSSAPHKNLTTLIEAFSVARSAIPEYQLAMVGDMGNRLTNLSSDVTNNGFLEPGSIVFTGRVSKEELLNLYCGASAFVFPSLYEGFGLPVVEAMASGVPVISSDSSCLPEICGDAALLVNATSAAELADAITRVITDENLASALVEKGKMRAANFSWERVAWETVAVYQNALAEG